MTPKERNAFLSFLYSDADRISHRALDIASSAQYLSAHMRRNSGTFDMNKASDAATQLREKLGEVEAGLKRLYYYIEGKANDIR